MSIRILFLSFVFVGCLSCKQTNTLFTPLSAQETGISFANTILENDTMNVLSFEYVYNGGGVALGDFNNDKKVDVYFTGNHVSNKLYLNKGNFHFDDITQKAQVTGNGKWSTGVALVDINNDHKLDIYVCASARKGGVNRANLLYINQGWGTDSIPIFKEMAESYGLADTTHNSNAAFFDYDNDGDLDVYIAVNERGNTRFPNQYHTKINDGTSPRTHRLYRNDANKTLGHPFFTNVSQEAGILMEGYGNGVNITDINRDGWKDIYVTNDYLTNDLLYINNRNGTFTEHLKDYFKHTSYSAMGVDIADMNNDGLLDVFALEMMPQSNQRKKMMVAANNYISYQNNEKYGYGYQYSRNTLQLNRGNDPNTGQPVFSEVGLLAGIAETDWSWTPMLTDFDNDGLRDLIITNGFPRDITDQDFIAYRSSVGTLMSKLMLVDSIPAVKLPNIAYHNAGNLHFEEVSAAWGITEPTFSNGAAYADLDNDGDLDYVVNNINDPASVYRNNLVETKPEESNYLRFTFEGLGTNSMGMGTWVEISYNKGEKQIYEHNIYRGYMSTVEDVAHFGLGKHRVVDEVRVLWPSGKQQILKNVQANQVILLSEAQATATPEPAKTVPPFCSLFPLPSVDTTQEIDYIDFNNQKLLPHKLSQYGPGLAVGDVNGDGLDDVYVGGAAQKKGYFLIQNQQGTFDKNDLLPGKNGESKASEEMGVLLLDVEKDGDLDLYAVSGSYEFAPNAPALQDHLFINDGKGHFTENTQALPVFLKSGSCVKANDFDHDGDLDLFVGGRVLAGGYPKPVSSYILRNDSQKNTPKFTDITARVAPALQNCGLISDALWTDTDNDGWTDLVLAGEWMPLTILKNKQGQLTKITTDLDKYVGWWTSLASGDFDNDGDMDYVAGNFGTNTLFKASDTQPLGMYADDFNNDGSYDAIPTVYFRDTQGVRREYPYNTRDDMVKQMITTRQRFSNYKSYSNAQIKDLLKPEELKKALVLHANWLKTSIIENKGKDVFVLQELPIETQFAPTYGITVLDVNQDGHIDIMLTGNDYGVEVLSGRMDAQTGTILLGNGLMGFKPLAFAQSGFYTSGDAKALVYLSTKAKQPLVMSSQNQGPLRCYVLPQKIQPMPLKDTESSAILTLTNGKKRKVEIPYGSSFLSQSAHCLFLDKTIVKVDAVR